MLIEDILCTDMWNKSKPRDYSSFRTFIFGITKQSMFPRGVVYEGVTTASPNTRLAFRGESGANDSIIPLLDIFLGIPYPHTPLTDILLDFRKYRPGNHREFLEWVKTKQDTLSGNNGEWKGMKGWAVQDREAAERWVRLADQVREFRWRHWCFTREYVLKESKHPTATGGSPIVNVSPPISPPPFFPQSPYPPSPSFQNAPILNCACDYNLVAPESTFRGAGVSKVGHCADGKVAGGEEQCGEGN